jgi:hypothetical protein
MVINGETMHENEKMSLKDKQIRAISMNTDYRQHSLYQPVLDIKSLTDKLKIYNKLKSCKTKEKSKAQANQIC